MFELSEIVLKSILIKISEKAALDVSKEVSDKIKTLLKKTSASGFADRLNKVGWVRTIIYPEESRNLRSIYCEDAVRLNSGIKIKALASFNNNHVLIEGKPGQGKSLFLRFLCLNQLRKDSSCIPFYIPLRNFNKDIANGLEDEIITFIQSYGFNIDVHVFRAFAKSGTIALILDGFDELNSAWRNHYAIELHELSNRYKNMRIVISSRPNSGLDRSEHFRKYQLKTLDLPSQIEFVKHISQDSIYSERLIRTLSTNKLLSEVADTPLLLSLYFLLYKQNQFEPSSVPEFYEKLFFTLLLGHDRSKLGYDRERLSKLTDYQFENLFRTISIITLQDNKTSFGYKYYIDAINRALPLANIDWRIDESKVIDDIERITSLIIQDGHLNYTFTHKSIQEYFASSFISKMKPEYKTYFYNSLVRSFSKYQNYSNVVNFLEIIDKDSYIKNFYTPLSQDIVDVILKERTIFGAHHKILGPEPSLNVSADGNTPKVTLTTGNSFAMLFFNELYSKAIALIHHLIEEDTNDSKAILMEYLEKRRVADSPEKPDHKSVDVDLEEFLIKANLIKPLIDSICREGLLGERLNFIFELEKDIAHKNELLSLALGFRAPPEN